MLVFLIASSQGVIERYGDAWGGLHSFDKVRQGTWRGGETKKLPQAVTMPISKYWWTLTIWKLLSIPLEFGFRARQQVEGKWCVKVSQWQSRLLVVNPGSSKSHQHQEWGGALHSPSPETGAISGRETAHNLAFCYSPQGLNGGLVQLGLHAIY